MAGDPRSPPRRRPPFSWNRLSWQATVATDRCHGNWGIGDERCTHSNRKPAPRAVGLRLGGDYHHRLPGRRRRPDPPQCVLAIRRRAILPTWTRVQTIARSRRTSGAAIVARSAARPCAGSARRARPCAGRTCGARSGSSRRSAVTYVKRSYFRRRWIETLVSLRRCFGVLSDA